MRKSVPLLQTLQLRSPEVVWWHFATVSYDFVFAIALFTPVSYSFRLGFVVYCTDRAIFPNNPSFLRPALVFRALGAGGNVNPQVAAQSKPLIYKDNSCFRDL